MITVDPVNDAPAFTSGADPVALEDAGPQTITGMGERDQTRPAGRSQSSRHVRRHEFEQPTVRSRRASRWSQPNGTLTFTPPRTPRALRPSPFRPSTRVAPQTAAATPAPLPRSRSRSPPNPTRPWQPATPCLSTRTTPPVSPLTCSPTTPTPTATPSPSVRSTPTAVTSGQLIQQQRRQLHLHPRSGFLGLGDVHLHPRRRDRSNRHWDRHNHNDRPA